MRMKEPEDNKTRQERRARKQRKKKERIPQHGKSLGRVYTDAVRKRAGDNKD